VLPELDRVSVEERSSIERIRIAALRSFATYGASATSLRTVAEAAGVSVGLVQHHFTNKAGLVKALGTMIMRGHVERQLPEPLTTPAQLQRWQESVNTLLREGQFRHTD